ncbi:MAG: O-methyltransferase [Chloroflexi bacterium]|jgi:predicted O-methyltransferase YrrM|nr:MAG: O-methyltransferase [Chloroflexi bacterium OLB13]MBC6955462.1 O-methyltransferase [Chloroflexota bacterium]MBV6436680.1 putative O-methyltransferase [Anaerolineae bacterium]MDL1915903.1 O-methyltransferase [Anaerolineae bacterium CFX4]OQY79549.1 MAG: methyltransferase [Anaerolineae bacterium UTCFX5]
MTQELWTAVDDYVQRMLIAPNPVLDAALVSSAEAGLPDIQVAPNQGMLLHLLARMQHPKRILEIGTLGGYSTIWLAMALAPGGRLITLEYEPRHAQVAQENIARAGLADRVEIRVGRALDSLAQLAAEGLDSFDLIFIDADKPNNPDYFRWALSLSRPGTAIIVDNVVRDGRVVDDASTDGSVRGVREMFDVIAAEPRVDATAIQTVGVKGYDGLLLALVKELA